jgi:predicted DNA-binding transcriptional regulator AlpA
MTPGTDPLLTEKDLSAWVGLSVPNLQRMRSSGTGPRFVQLSPRRIGYRKSEVEAWLTSRTTDRVGALTFAGRTSGPAADVEHER